MKGGGASADWRPEIHTKWLNCIVNAGKYSIDGAYGFFGKLS